MNKLHTFGCSFTFGNGLFPAEPYFKYKSSDDDLIWPEIVSKHFGFELCNWGEGLMSNDRILDRIITKIPEIDSEDTVILQMSYHHRFDIPNKKDNLLLTIAPNAEPILRGEYSQSEIKKVCFVASLWDSNLYKERNILRFKFLQDFFLNVLKVKCCVLWDISETERKYENIKTATNEKITDFHWSYKGHKDFARNMILSIENNEKRIRSLS